MLAYSSSATGRPGDLNHRGIVNLDPTCPQVEQDPPPQEPWYRVMVPRFLHREHVAGQLLRFVVVGVANTFVDLAAFYALSLIPGVPDIAAKAISYFLGICNSFIWNKYWTFSAARSARGRREFALFFLVNLPPLLVNVVVFTLLGLWVGQGTFVARMGKAFIAAVITVAWNFVGSRYLAFRHTALKGKPHE